MSASVSQELLNAAYWEGAQVAPALSFWQNAADFPSVCLTQRAGLLPREAHGADDTFSAIVNSMGWHTTTIVRPGELTPVVNSRSPSILRLVLDERRRGHRSCEEDTLKSEVEADTQYFDEKAAAMLRQDFSQSSIAAMRLTERGTVTSITRLVLYGRSTRSGGRLVCRSLQMHPASAITGGDESSQADWVLDAGPPMILPRIRLNVPYVDPDHASVRMRLAHAELLTPRAPSDNQGGDKSPTLMAWLQRLALPRNALGGAEA